MRPTTDEAAKSQYAASRLFGAGGKPTGTLMIDKVLNKEQRAALQASFAGMADGNASKLYILEANMKYEQLSMSPEDQQLLETRQFGVEEICRWFKVPPFMVGHMDKASSWASSVEAQNLHFLTNTLRPILDNIEQEIIRCLIPAHERGTIYAEFGVEGLLRADSAGRAAYYNTLLQNGVFNRNEVRALENRAPIPGGEIYTVQTNLTPIDQLGKSTQSEAARNALKAWLAELPAAQNA